MNKNLIIVIAVLAIGAFAVYKYRTPRFRAGDTAPNFEATLLNGEKVHLSDLKGHYVLLQFWGSWCGPCRAENPQLVELYNKYHDRGFEIFSIGLERNPVAWQRAIQQDQMRWKYHASDLQDFDGVLPKLFNIKSIPATFLINAEGNIMGVSLEPDQIDKKLALALTK